MKKTIKIAVLGLALTLGIGITTDSTNHLLGIQTVQAQEAADDESELELTESCWINGKYVSCTITGCLTGKIDCKPEGGCCD